MSNGCVNVGLMPPMNFRKLCRRVEGVNPYLLRQCRKMIIEVFLEVLNQDISWLLKGVFEYGWKHLDNDMIVMCYQEPLKWCMIMGCIVVVS